jgi:hypothetical protein
VVGHQVGRASPVPSRPRGLTFCLLETPGMYVMASYSNEPTLKSTPNHSPSGTPHSSPGLSDLPPHVTRGLPFCQAGTYTLRGKPV